MVKFFINRPIFATVLALIIVVAGLVTLNILPIAQYPDITPPTVQVSAVYPGADAQTVAQTVGLPIEQQVNGVDGMLYMSSNSSSSGAYSLTITFAVGTDIDMATVMVQNRVSIAQSSLPEAVIVQGITTKKQSSNIVMMLSLTSRDSLYDGLYLSNYASLNLTDQLARLPGVGKCHGSRQLQYAYLARPRSHAHPQPDAGHGFPGYLHTEQAGFCRLCRAANCRGEQSLSIHPDRKRPADYAGGIWQYHPADRARR